MNSLHLYLQCYMDHQYLHARACSVSEYVFDRNLEAKWVMNCLSFSVLNSSSSNVVGSYCGLVDWLPIAPCQLKCIRIPIFISPLKSAFFYKIIKLWS